MAVFLRKLPYNDKLVITKGDTIADQRTGRARIATPDDEGKPTDEMAKWAESMERQSSASPVAPQPAEQLTNIAASDSGTLGGDIPSGIYAVYAYREVVVADPVSSSLALSIGWTHNGKALTRLMPAFSGAPQTVSDTSPDSPITIEIDPNTAISYTLTYASNTPGLARFQCSLIANLLQNLS